MLDMPRIVRFALDHPQQFSEKFAKFAAISVALASALGTFIFFSWHIF
jgi:hypothetical protein